MRLADQIQSAPLIHDVDMGDRNLRSLTLRLAASEEPEAAQLAALVSDEGKVAALLKAIFSASPYLSRLILSDPVELWRILDSDPGGYLQKNAAELAGAIGECRRFDEAMKTLRSSKRRLALAVALSDLGGVWTVDQVTSALAAGADSMLHAAIEFLFAQAAQQGHYIARSEDQLATGSGYIVLGMGKYGAMELNYSSDIDLIVFYDPHKTSLAEGVELGPFFVKMTRDLVRLLTERTSEGYVFRTDLRLRPDPGATQLALSTDAAFHYYETVGQNWERAAFIKARAVAGDLAAGNAFLRELSPYIWRKYLDYAAIADIHAMKRQIHQHKGHSSIAIAGHNLKLGRGGIREIEFFVQTQQLIAGGRQTDLRTSQTLTALERLVDHAWITRDIAADMSEAYRFLRTIEHRLQMLDDEQTHSLPAKPDKFERVACFSGFENSEALAAAVRKRLETVQRHYASLFEDVPGLSTEGTPGNLVFTGESDDPDTVKTLGEMGFSNPSSVISKVKSWHFGRYPATRTARARENLTEFQPHLLEALSRTAQPDLALVTFDRFLAELPAGIQLFAMLRNNPDLFKLLASIMGSAPRLARLVSRRPRLIDVVLDSDFLDDLPSPKELEKLVSRQLAEAQSYEDCLDRIRQFGQEQSFLIGIRVLSCAIDAGEAGLTYSALADAIITGLKIRVEQIMIEQNGMITDGQMAVLGMGKLGGREMVANSDLDLIIIYRYTDDSESSGPKPLAPTQYFNRATQRLISALSVPTAEGNLYDVDMRLRPSGKSGPVATSLAAFQTYQDAEAWTWEHMALTRARIIAGAPDLQRDIEANIDAILTRPRDRAKIAADVIDMRDRIAKDKGAVTIWNLKHVRGGMVDIEFIAQFLQLVHAAKHPGILDQNTIAALEKARSADLLTTDDAECLIAAARLYGALSQIMRLCQDGHFNPSEAPAGLQELVRRATGLEDFAEVAPLLERMQSDVSRLYDQIIC